VKGNHNRRGSSETSGDGLATAVKLWPTPCANDDNKSPEAHMAMKRRMGRNTITSLQVRIKQEHNGGTLSPAWVEILMGFPIGWTDIDCDNPQPWPGWPAGMGERLWMTPKSEACGMTAKTSGRPLEMATHLSSQTFVAERDCVDQYPYEPPRTCKNVPNRAKRLKALGNAVVPQQAAPFFEAIREMNA